MDRRPTNDRTGENEPVGQGRADMGELQSMSLMGSDERDDEVGHDIPTAHLADEEGVMAFVQSRARAVSERITLEVQDHPLRTLAIAGVVGFLIASGMKYRTLPAMIRSGAGIAAAMALRELAERGLSRLDISDA